MTSFDVLALELRPMAHTAVSFDLVEATPPGLKTQRPFATVLPQDEGDQACVPGARRTGPGVSPRRTSPLLLSHPAVSPHSCGSRSAPSACGRSTFPARGGATTADPSCPPRRNSSD